MALEVGKIQTETGRDAIHVPVVSVYCADAIRGGDRVCFCDDSLTSVRIARKDEKHHAIVDPFLPWIKRLNNCQVLVMLKPGTVNKLIHHFEPCIEGLPKAYQYEDYSEDENDSCRGCY